MDGNAWSAAIVRDVNPQDIAAITRIYGGSVRTGTASFELEAPAEDEMARRVARVLDQGYPFLVAERRGDLLGYAYASAWRPRPGYRFAVEDSVYVAPEAHRQGVGRALLSALIVRCESKGFRQMVAVIGDSGNEASIGLHRDFGFAPAGCLPGLARKFGRWFDSVILIRPLGAGAATPPAGETL